MTKQKQKFMSGRKSGMSVNLAKEILASSEEISEIQLPAHHLDKPAVHLLARFYLANILNQYKDK